MTSKDVVLLPCAFCGGAVETRHYHPDMGPSSCFVKCWCGARGTEHQYQHGDHKEAIAKAVASWNRRTVETTHERATFIELLNLAEHFLAERQPESEENALRKRIADALTQAPAVETPGDIRYWTGFIDASKVLEASGPEQVWKMAESYATSIDLAVRRAVEPTSSRRCQFDTDGDGNCPLHPTGCPPTEPIRNESNNA